MTDEQERAHLQRYSQGETGRRELQSVLERDLGYADILRLLHKHELKLPRTRLYPSGPAIDILRQRLRRVPRG